MATYGDLKADTYYVVQEENGNALELVYITMHTSKCVLVEYQDEDQTLVWHRKTDELQEIVDELTDTEALEYESIFEDDENEFWNDLAKEEEGFWDEDDDDEDDDFEDFDDDFEDLASKN